MAVDPGKALGTQGASRVYVGKLSNTFVRCSLNQEDL